jgi:hypothetical protein
MSRSNYTEDCDDEWRWIMWRGAVTSAIRGKRGQAFLREMLDAMDALPEKKLVSWELETDGQVCAIGSVGRRRGMDMSKLDPEDPVSVAAAFGISSALVREIVYENDESAWFIETPEHRFGRMRRWIASQISEPQQ